MKNSIDAFLSLLKKYRGRIFYYGGVALVIAAIAFAADSYRSSEPEELVMPSAEVSAVLERMQEPEIIHPEGMRLLNGFSSQPQWNGTLRQWECHEASDYSLAGGIAVCLEGGTVQDVGESGVYGGYVEILCEDRLYRYASVIPDASLKPGAGIKAGDRIGAAHSGMPGERQLGAHLHLEVFEDGKPTDFESLYTKKGT